MKKAPHYSIGHVDFSIANIQRTFTFDNKTIYDAFQEIAEEIDCLFMIRCYSDKNGVIKREVNVYDLESYCLECGERGDFISDCDKCGSSNILTGYGDDTGIFVTVDNLAEGINYTTDVGSVKNCFRLEAGDDLMTATITNCNPNGSSYIWHISDETKKDMSNELVQKLEEYDEQYDYYQKEHQINVETSLLTQYNNLVEKYSIYSKDYKKISTTIVGYPSLMEVLYNTIDFYLYLNNSLMPSIETSNTSASIEIAKLTTKNLSPVAVQNLSTCSSSTAESAVLSLAKTIVDHRYQVKIIDTAFANNIWSGKFVLTNYSDDTDTSTSNRISLNITDDYEKYVNQKINKALDKTLNEDDATDILQLFDLSAIEFANELKKYSLTRLNSFYECCQSCIDILIQQGIANNDTWADSNPNLYLTMYMPYYTKLQYIEEEILLRENEISIIIGEYANDNTLLKTGIQNFLENERAKIQEALDFEKYLGEDLWLEFVAYRREDTYSNSNYISDGLDNSEIFNKALEFIKVANKEIYFSSTLQHSITATLKNLLVMKEFEPIVHYFEVGNWIRIKVDSTIYRLRILGYEIDYSNLGRINITFSDVAVELGSMSNSANLIEAAGNIATSYNAVTRQASQGQKSNEQLNNWVNNGLALTKMKIIDDADNQNLTWDSHGLLCKEYLPITDTYDGKQLKIINRGLYLTDDNWLTSRAGIGDFTFWNPKTQRMENDYGVIANTLVGKLVLSESVEVYNIDNSIALNKDGFTITSNGTDDNSNKIVFTVQKKELDDNGDEYLTPIVYLDDNGNLVLNGTIQINTPFNDETTLLNDLADTSRFTNEISNRIYEAIHGENGVDTSISQKYDEVRSYAENMLNDYKSDLGQYLNHGDNGLTLGAVNSTFKTVLDNQRMAFYERDNIAAYISNNQLHIPNAVIQQTLLLGRFFFSPREDGGVSIVWQSA